MMSFYICTKLLVTTKLDSITLVVMHHLSAVTNRLLVILRNAFVGKASTRFTSGRRLLTSDRYLVVGMLMQFISIIQCYAWGQDCATYFAPATSYKAHSVFNEISISTRDLPLASDFQSEFFFVPTSQHVPYASNPIENIIVDAQITPVPTSDAISDTLSEDEFQYAQHLRYTMDGSAPLRFSKIKPIPMILTGGLYAGAIWGLHVYQKQTLWNQRSDRFHVAEDGDYALHVDKCGHFFGGYIMSYYASEILQSSGVSYQPARVWGTLMGIMYMGYIEAEDGFATGWSFSPSDFYWNVTGATYHLLQSYVPVLQNFTPKWIYMPSNLIGEHRRLTDYHTMHEADNFNDDYSSSTFFLSMKMHNLLPEGWKEYWPKWITLDVGYAARNLGWIDPKNYLQDRKLIIALDYDLVEMLPDFSKCVGGNLGNILNWLKQSCNYFKFPSPALEFGESGMTRFNLLYPFKIRIGSFKF
ncbi:MAG: DUF2279 domain-containing protein [Candidatus Kapaibacterium sp.]|nr:YfiM family protein [Bacteroidota bacterium]